MRLRLVPYAIAITTGVVLGPSLAGYSCVTGELLKGRSVDNIETNFWFNYSRIPKYQKILAITARPGIKLAYLQE